MNCDFHQLNPHVINDNLRQTLAHLQDHPPHYSQIINELASKVSQLTHTQISYALNFILSIANIEHNCSDLMFIEDESIRNKKISELTGLPAEPGLLIGQTPQAIQESIAFRVNELMATFEFDKSLDDTISFFKEAFVGPPCLNGRFISLEKYRCSKQLGITIQEFVAETQKRFPDWTLPFTDPEIDGYAVQIEEFFYQYLDENKTLEIPSVEVFLSYFNHATFTKIYDENKFLFERIYQRAISIYKGY